MYCSGCLVQRSLTEDSNVLLELSSSEEVDSEWGEQVCDSPPLDDVLLEFSSSDDVDSEWGEQVCDSPPLDDGMKAPSCWQIKLDGFYTNTRPPPVARVCGPPLDDGRPMCCLGCLVHRSLTEDSNVLLEFSSSDEVDSEWGEQVCNPSPLDDGMKGASCWQIKLEGFYTNTGPHKSLGCAVLHSTTGPMCCSGCLVHRSLNEGAELLTDQTWRLLYRYQVPTSRSGVRSSARRRDQCAARVV